MFFDKFISITPVLYDSCSRPLKYDIFDKKHTNKTRWTMERMYLVIYKTESSCHETTKVCQSEHANWNAEYCINHGHNHTPIRLRCYMTISCKKNKIILEIFNILTIKGNTGIRIWDELFVSTNGIYIKCGLFTAKKLKESFLASDWTISTFLTHCHGPLKFEA